MTPQHQLWFSESAVLRATQGRVRHFHRLWFNPLPFFLTHFSAVHLVASSWLPYSTDSLKVNLDLNFGMQVIRDLFGSGVFRAYLHEYQGSQGKRILGENSIVTRHDIDGKPWISFVNRKSVKLHCVTFRLAYKLPYQSEVPVLQSALLRTYSGQVTLPSQGVAHVISKARKLFSVLYSPNPYTVMCLSRYI